MEKAWPSSPLLFGLFFFVFWHSNFGNRGGFIKSSRALHRPLHSGPVIIAFAWPCFDSGAAEIPLLCEQVLVILLVGKGGSLRCVLCILMFYSVSGFLFLYLLFFLDGLLLPYPYLHTCVFQTIFPSAPVPPVPYSQDLVVAGGWGLCLAVFGEPQPNTYNNKHFPGVGRVHFVLKNLQGGGKGDMASFCLHVKGVVCAFGKRKKGHEQPDAGNRRGHRYTIWICG